MKVRTSPVAQRLGVRLPVQGTRVQSLVQEDLTCCTATGPGFTTAKASVL